MGNKKGKDEDHIIKICMVNGLDKDDIQKKAERFLEINHEMSWNRSIYRVKNIEEMLVKNEEKINDSIFYLENLDYNECDVEIEKKLKPLYDTRIMNDILNYTYMKMKDYPFSGELYYTIISMLYLKMCRYKIEDIIDRCNLSRPAYYRRRKEAVILFGIVLWSIAIPFLKENFNCSVNEFRSLLQEAGNVS